MIRSLASLFFKSESEEVSPSEKFYESLEAICSWISVETILAIASRNRLHPFDKDIYFEACIHMHNEAIEHARAVNLLVFKGRFDSAEALSRIAIESCINLEYALVDSEGENIKEHVFSYIRNETGKIKKWLKWAEKSPFEREVIELIKNPAYQRSADLRRREADMEKLFEYHDTKKAAPQNVREKYKSIGREADYLMAYQVLCVKAHGGAEDLINKLSDTLMNPGRSREFLHSRAEKIKIHSKYLAALSQYNLLLASNKICLAITGEGLLEFDRKKQEILALLLSLSGELSRRIFSKSELDLHGYFVAGGLDFLNGR